MREYSDNSQNIRLCVRKILCFCEETVLVSTQDTGNGAYFFAGYR